jgi:hypothetical protein
MLNELFLRQGRTGERARISAESIRRAERQRRQPAADVNVLQRKAGQ